MSAITPPPARPLQAIWTVRAAELMTPNPGSIREDATILDAVRFLVDKGYSAAPVINEAGRPIGVVSRADVLVHDREMAELLHPDAERIVPRTPITDPSCVRDIMSPFVLVVDPETPADAVARQMVAFRVHRLFVVDSNGVLVGVISALDLLRHLQPVAQAEEQPRARSAYHED